VSAINQQINQQWFETNEVDVHWWISNSLVMQPPALVSAVNPYWSYTMRWPTWHALVDKQ